MSATPHSLEELESQLIEAKIGLACAEQVNAVSFSSFLFPHALRHAELASGTRGEAPQD